MDDIHDEADIEQFLYIFVRSPERAAQHVLVPHMQASDNRKSSSLMSKSHRFALSI